MTKFLHYSQRRAVCYGVFYYCPNAESECFRVWGVIPSRRTSIRLGWREKAPREANAGFNPSVMCRYTRRSHLVEIIQWVRSLIPTVGNAHHTILARLILTTKGGGVDGNPLNFHRSKKDPLHFPDWASRGLL